MEGESRKEMASLPCTPSSGEGAMKPFPTLLVPYFLLPDGDIGAIIAGVRVERWERRAVDDKGRLLRLKVGLICRSRSLGGHVDSEGCR